VRKISDLVWKAANKELWTGIGQRRWIDCEYSCVAASLICRSDNEWTRTRDFLKDLGCPINSYGVFREFRAGQERQGARYLWLDFARLVAESEDL